MNIYDEKEKCCACTACFSKCPVNAIEMRTDEEGFTYPYVIKDRCVNCGQCIAVCPLQKENVNDEPIQIIAAKNKKMETRMNSSSGGVFSILAEYIEKQEGRIYGVAFNDDFSVIHKGADKHKEWQSFCTSKYVQSDLFSNHIFQNIKEDLRNNRYVLFTGTPCQVDGLKQYLKGENIDKLLTVDIVCHGVPSPGIWKEYLNKLEKKEKTKISQVNFRDKKDGWHNSKLRIASKNNVILHEAQSENFFSKLFFNHFIMRPSCYCCEYSNFRRCSDITLGDYWGIEKYYPKLDDNKGVSLILINSNKGLKILEVIKNQMESISIKKEEALQPNLCQPSFKPGNREIFWKAYKKKGLIYAGKRVGLLKPVGKEKICIFLERLLQKIKNEIKKLML